MSLDAREQSTYQAAPIEAYRFVSGSNAWQYTSSDDRITLNLGSLGIQSFSPEAMSRTEAEFSQEDQSGSIRIVLPRLNPVSTLLMAGLPPTPISLTIWRTHEGEGQLDIAFIGKIVQALFSGPNAELTAASLSQVLARKVPRPIYQKLCNRLLYGPGCGVSRAAFTDTGTVSAVSGFDVQAAVFATRADGWFEAGYLERADGSRQYITAHVGNTVTLQSPFLALAVGESISAVAGCKRRELEDCDAKFSNLVNHLGFKRIPSTNPYRIGMT